MEPREFFPKMPDEVFSNWLVPHIQLYGWPFKTPDDDFTNYVWPNCFSIHHSLKQWTECEWKLITIPVEFIKLNNRTALILRDIIFNAVKVFHASTTDMIRTKERFWACASFYKRFGTISSPIVIYNFTGETRILDGFHRLSSIIHIGFEPGFSISAWKAKI